MNPQYQQKLALLNQTTENVFSMLAGISTSQLQRWDYGWSIIQVLSHLEMAERLSLAYMKKKILAGNKMKSTTPIHKLKMWLTCRLMKSSIKWKAPKPISNPPNDFSLEEIHKKWMDTRKDVVGFVNEYPKDYFRLLIYKHPLAGRQAMSQAIDSLIYHQCHHIHQIKRIRKKLNF